jgi:hypothetical protein
VLPLANGKHTKRREQMKPSALDEDQYGVLRSEDDNGDNELLQLRATQERDASVTAEFVKAEVLAKVTFAMSEKDPGSC